LYSITVFVFLTRWNLYVLNIFYKCIPQDRSLMSDIELKIYWPDNCINGRCSSNTNKISFVAIACGDRIGFFAAGPDHRHLTPRRTGQKNGGEERRIRGPKTGQSVSLAAKAPPDLWLDRSYDPCSFAVVSRADKSH